MNDKVNFTRVISGPIDEVFDAFVNPTKMDQWHHPDGYSSKNKVDGEKSFETIMLEDRDGGQEGTISGEYLEFVRPTRLVFTWSWNWDPNMAPTTVSVHFKTVEGNKTEVSLVHSGFTDAVDAKQHKEGWEMAFNHLNEFLAKQLRKFERG